MAFAREAGYPVVLKIISPEWLHKSDLGGVRLNIGDEAQLQAAFRELTELFEVRTPEGSLEGFLVQKQVQGVELLLGLKRDPQFGPVLVAGAGGIYTEILRDIARGFVPLSRERARCMLAALKIYPILAGTRGQAGVNLEALLDLMLGLSRLAVDYPEIRELDLNPVVANRGLLVRRLAAAGVSSKFRVSGIRGQHRNYGGHRPPYKLGYGGK